MLHIRKANLQELQSHMETWRFNDMNDNLVSHVLLLERKVGF